MNAHKAISLKTKLRVVLSLTALILLSGLSVRVDGATTSYTYDALNRLTQTTYPNGSVISVYLRCGGQSAHPEVYRVSIANADSDSYTGQ